MKTNNQQPGNSAELKNRPGIIGDSAATTTATLRDAPNNTPTLPGLDRLVQPFKFKATAHEYKVVPLRESVPMADQFLCDKPDLAARYWSQNVTQNPYFDPERECFTVLLLNTRRRIKGHQLLTIGTADTLLVHPRDVFRLPIITSAAAIILMHNHPSGDPSPSEADIKVTRDLIRAGQLLKIEVLDHVIMGSTMENGRNYVSLRELGYFYQ